MFMAVHGMFQLIMPNIKLKIIDIGIPENF